MNEEKINFIAVGDTVIDAFIRLNTAEETIDVDHHIRKLCLSFADKVPYEFAEVIPSVGNAANAAVSAARLGLSSSIVTNLGNDQYGKDCLESFIQKGVKTNFIKIHQDKTTNYHYVLWFHADRTILIKHEKYEYALPDIGTPSWLYLSSLGENSLPFLKIIGDYMIAHPEINLAFQPGVFDMSHGTEALKDIYGHAKIFFCNVEEAQKILKTEENDKKKLMRMVADLGPKIVVTTDGPDGAYAYDSVSDQSYFMKPYPDPKPPYERTGAGDAFSSTFAIAIAHGLSIPEAMKWGSVNSMSVVQQVGAQKGLLTRIALEKYLKEAPVGWEAEII